MHGQIEAMDSAEIQWQKEHEEMHRKHANHDVMHAEILIIFIIALIFFQLILIWWKAKNFKSYQLVSLLGLWAIPFFVAITKYWYRFIFTWVIFTVFNIYLYRKTSQPHISGKIPRLVYKWFLFLHKMSYFLGVVGYLIMMLTLLGLNTIFSLKANDCLDAGILFLCYGLYYGVLIKDLAEITSEKMACKIGYFTSDGLPKKVLENNICAICGDKLNLTGQLLRTDKDFDDDNDAEAVHALSCQHLFHEYCLRGFVIVGKMATCPYCKEKINYSATFKNPWEKPHLLYGQFLDWVRYLVVWQPLIVLIVQGVTKFFGLE
uniref:RING-type domain-containing protein n=1 Tax=Strongyloides papillosus TaxID=174720 RepID=A0A0N5B8P5_STREA